MVNKTTAGTGSLPAWVPEAAQSYLSHTESGRSIRALARDRGVHPSTILRQVRRIEMRRDDPLVDAAIQSLADLGNAAAPLDTRKDQFPMTQPLRTARPPAEDDINREGRRILHRLLETGALLAVAPEMEKAVVVRDTPDGRTLRTAALDRPLAEAMALREWIEPVPGTGRIQRYRIGAIGRAALKRLIAAEETAASGFAEAQAPFGAQHRDWAEREIVSGRERLLQRYNAAESPVTALARRREKDGTPFLDDDLVAAAERLREDFELAQLGPRVTQNWERLMTGGGDDMSGPGLGPASGPGAARDRVAAALRELGPGLGDVALRCCCYLEGLEAAEQRMGWASRSGKVVLRIALQRLRRHYRETGGTAGVLIG